MKRLILLVAIPATLLTGVGVASASSPASGDDYKQICIAVSSDPNSNGRDGICIRYPELGAQQ